MDAERWQQIQNVFSSALERDAGERFAYVDGACAGDPLLRDAVQDLLERDEAADRHGFLTGASLFQLSDVALDPGASAEADRFIGRQMGHYEIQRRIGSGGMGNVYLAVRTTDYQSHVAIKLIRRGMDSEAILRRFRDEMRFLAALSNHPNIASLHDAGTTEDGQPYLVMEYIEGEPIDRYCDQHKLSIRDRLTLFCEAAEAVQFAHQNAILHRDLKPSNLMVTADGRPRLIDFGIAKLAEDDRSADHAATLTQHRALTPDYASPEQIRGEPLSAASDVYSLGVVLYELLCGHRPYYLQALTPAQIEGAVCGTDPLKPSDAIQRTGTMHSHDASTEEVTPEIVGDRRRVEPRALRRTLQGDLDRIVLQALHKDISRRYQTVAQLIADIRRYLDHLPVTAAKDTFRYRTTKFVQRNKGLVAGLAAMVVLSISWVATATWLTVAARQAEQREREQRIVAQSNERTANRVVELLKNMFAASDPRNALGQEKTVREVLDEYGSRLSAELKDEPLVEARLMGTIGHSYIGLGAHAQALDKFRRALELRKEVQGENSPETLFEEIQVAKTLIGLNRLDEAEIILTDALDRARRTQGRYHLTTLHAKWHLGTIYAQSSRFDDAERLLSESYQDCRESLGEEHELSTAVLNQLSVLRFNEGRYEDSAKIMKRIVAIEEKTRKEEDPSFIFGLANLAAALGAQQKFEESAQFGARALALSRRVQGDTHIRTRVWMRDLAETYHHLQRFEESEPLFREWYAAWQKQNRDPYPQIIDSLFMWGIALKHLGNYAEAEKRLRQAYNYYIRHNGAEDAAVVPIRRELQDLYRSTNRGDLAQALQPTPPAAPQHLEPGNLAEVSTDTVELHTSEFQHEIASVRPSMTHWQIRDQDGDYDRSPTLDIVSQADLSALRLPPGLLISNRRYFWRVRYIGSNRVPSAFSEETAFVTDGDDFRFVSLDLSAYLNRDVVANPGDDNDDTFDGPGGARLVVAGFDGQTENNPHVQGLPSDRRVGPHVLASYSEANALQLSNQDGEPIRIDTSLENCRAIRVLVAGGNGQTSLPITLEFASGTSEEHVVYCPDWYNNQILQQDETFCTPILNGMDRLRYDKFDDDDKPALFEVILQVGHRGRLTAIVLEPDKADFQRTTTYFNLFAITLVGFGR